MLRNLLLTGVLFLISGLLFATTIGNLDPLGEQKLIALVVFYVSMFCGITSFFTFLFFFGSELLSGRKLRTQHFLIAVRRGIFVGVFVITLLVLQMFRLLGLFEVTLLAIFLSLLEFIILSAKKGK
jgi:hypothetical protein